MKIVAIILLFLLKSTVLQYIYITRTVTRVKQSIYEPDEDHIYIWSKHVAHRRHQRPCLKGKAV